MFTSAQISMLVLVAVLGHLMAFGWYTVDKRRHRLCQKRIYDVPFPKDQLRREAWNSLHTPLHAVMLAASLGLGAFSNTSVWSFFGSLLGTAAWAEVWHYFSHRLLHLRPLFWIHEEHHKSHLNSPLTAISFSFSEKFIFNIGLIGFLMLVDLVVSVNFFGVAGWYVAYLIVNSYGHANFEIRSKRFLEIPGKYIATTVYHSLHHSRFVKNYGLGTRFLDKAFGTEWADYEDVYARVTSDLVPLTKLSEKIGPIAKP